MSRADGCPEACGNVEPPEWTEDKPGGFLAGYHCRYCGKRWVTSWRD